MGSGERIMASASALAAELRDPNAPDAPIRKPRRKKATAVSSGSVGTSSTTAPVVNGIAGRTLRQPPLAALGGVLMQKFEKISELIDSSLEGDSILPMCANGNGQNGKPPASDLANTTAETVNLSQDVPPSPAESPDASPVAAAPPKSLDKEPTDHISNFASWLASQEFDASAIVWNGDDGNPKDLSAELPPDSDVLSDMGRTSEYSRDEFLANRTANANGKAGDGDASVDGYVSLADQKPDQRRGKFWSHFPPAVSEVWNQVASSNWRCWQDGVGANNVTEPSSVLAGAKFSGLGSRVPGKTMRSGAKKPPSILKKSSFDVKSIVSDSSAGYSSWASRSKASVAHRRNKSLDKFVVVAPGNKKGQPRHAHKPSWDTFLVMNTSIETAEDRKPQKIHRRMSSSDKGSVATPKSEASRGMDRSVDWTKPFDESRTEKKTPNLDDLLFEAAAFRMNEARPIDDATSIATPLAGEDIDIAFTPKRLDRTVGSCTYSISPGRSAASPATSSAHAPSSVGLEMEEEDPFRLASQLAPDNDEANGDDNSDAPLIASDGHVVAKGRKSKGRTRRRMRLAK
ncbi:hypothetical protein ACHAXT_012593 [Thalassiosira profunda]